MSKSERLKLIDEKANVIREQHMISDGPAVSLEEDMDNFAVAVFGCHSHELCCEN